MSIDLGSEGVYTYRCAGTSRRLDLGRSYLSAQDNALNPIPNGMKTGWWSFELPQYRPHRKRATYSLFPYEELPPLTESPDPHFAWLRSQSAKSDSLFEGGDADGGKPDLSKLADIASGTNVRLPEAFVTFMSSPDLHRRIRSCTACYLDLADFPVKTKGNGAGYLFHFLSDSQWAGHWYVHVDPQGHHFVVTSPNAYGFAFGDEQTGDPEAEIDLHAEEIWFCAASFPEFIYRFWLENEIWFALAKEKRTLTQIEQAYVDRYSGMVK